MNKNRIIYTTGFIGALAAFIMMIIMLVIHLNIDCDYMNDLKRCLGAGDPEAAVRIQENAGILSAALGVDTLMLFGQMFVWLGLFVLVKENSIVKAWLVLLGGLAGAALDFVQNCIEFFVIRLAGSVLVFGQAMYSAWNFVTVLSYLAAFAAGLVLISAILKKNRKSIIMCTVSVLFTIAAAAGIFIDVFYPASFLWYVVLFAVSGIVFIQKIRH